MIDSHVHIGGDEAGFLMNEEMVLTSMEKYNIDISIVSNGDSVEYGENFVRVPEEMQSPQEETLARVIKFCRENPGKIYGAFWCKPNHEVVTEELDKMIADNRDIILALKVHPTLSNLSFTNEKMHPYLKLAENLYADTTWVPVETTLEVIKRYGSEHVMFGSDNPIDGVDTYSCNPLGEPCIYREYFGSLKEKISKEDYENLMEKTARRVFGI